MCLAPHQHPHPNSVVMTKIVPRHCQISPEGQPPNLETTILELMKNIAHSPNMPHTPTIAQVGFYCSHRNLSAYITNCGAASI